MLFASSSIFLSTAINSLNLKSQCILCYHFNLFLYLDFFLGIQVRIQPQQWWAKQQAKNSYYITAKKQTDIFNTYKSNKYELFILTLLVFLPQLQSVQGLSIRACVIKKWNNWYLIEVSVGCISWRGRHYVFCC